MRLESGFARAFRLPLRAPLATARGPIPFRDGALLSLRDRDGLEGSGEASPLPGFHREDAAASARELTGWVADASGRGIVGLDDSRQVNVIGGPGGQFHCIIDISGYYI